MDCERAHRRPRLASQQGAFDHAQAIFEPQSTCRRTSVVLTPTANAFANPHTQPPILAKRHAICAAWQQDSGRQLIHARPPPHFRRRKALHAALPEVHTKSPPRRPRNPRWEPCNMHHSHLTQLVFALKSPWLASGQLCGASAPTLSWSHDCSHQCRNNKHG